MESRAGQAWPEGRGRARAMSDQPFRTIFEPFRIQWVEPMRLTTRTERTAALAAAGYNLFALRAEEVLIDLLTDSGTAAMSAEQWAGIQRGDEAYAGAPSFHRFRDAVTSLFPCRTSCRPTRAGRRADPVRADRRAGQGRSPATTISTPRGPTSSTPAPRPSTWSIAEGTQPRSRHPFKGNIDLAALER